MTRPSLHASGERQNESRGHPIVTGWVVTCLAGAFCYAVDMIPLVPPPSGVPPVMSANLSELFVTLDAVQQRIPLPELKALLGDCSVVCEEVAHLLRFSAKTYQRIPLRGSDWYQAWVMCWRNGQRSPIHDHKGSSCSVRVLQGTMTETLFDFAPNGHVKARSAQDYEPGDVIGGADSDVHQVSNLQGGNADLVTLHVYSPPLVFMGTYDMTSANRGLEAMMIEFSDAAGI